MNWTTEEWVKKWRSVRKFHRRRTFWRRFACGLLAISIFMLLQAIWQVVGVRNRLVEMSSRKGEVEIVAGLAEKYGGEVEVVLEDRSRVDLLTSTHAYEADWAYKWAEGVGQSVHYSLMTGKAPGLILLTRDRKKDQRHLERAERVCDFLMIQLRVEKVK